MDLIICNPFSLERKMTQQVDGDNRMKPPFNSTIHRTPLLSGRLSHL